MEKIWSKYEGRIHETDNKILVTRSTETIELDTEALITDTIKCDLKKNLPMMKLLQVLYIRSTGTVSSLGH